MKIKTTEAMKLKKFHSHQARLVRLWQDAGMDVPNDFEGNLAHYALCTVADCTEDEDTPSSYIGIDTKRSPLVEIDRVDTSGMEKAFTAQGFDSFDEARKASSSGEYAVVVRCRTCHCINHAVV